SVCLRTARVSRPEPRITTWRTAIGELRVEPVVIIAGPKPGHFLSGWEVSADCRGSLLRTLVEENMDDWIAIERIGLLVLAGAKLGHNKGSPGNLPDLVHRSPGSRVLLNGLYSSVEQ